MRREDSVRFVHRWAGARGLATRVLCFLTVFPGALQRGKFGKIHPTVDVRKWLASLVCHSVIGCTSASYRR
jgi:hypothetical protein